MQRTHTVESIRNEIDAVEHLGYGAVDDVGRRGIERLKIRKRRHDVGRYGAAIESSRLENGIADLGAVLTGEDVIVRENHRPAVSCAGSHEAAYVPAVI